MEFPHHYRVVATAGPAADVVLTADRLAPLPSNAPAQFGGPGDKWSPEDLLTAAVADCFVLSFRAIAAASKFGFTSLQVAVTGTLDRIERVMSFQDFRIEATLTVPAGTDPERARRLLEKAEQTCLITNSLKSTVHLETSIVEG